MRSLSDWKIRSEALLLLVILCFAGVVGISNSSFVSLDNIFDLLRNSIVIGIFALGAMIVLASGGIDVSFAAIAVFSFYAATRLLIFLDIQDGVLLGFFVAACMGLLLGSINAFFVARYQLPALIVTLGTLSLLRGALPTFLGSDYITRLPDGMVEFARLSLLQGSTSEGAAYRLPAAFLILVGFSILTSLILNRTMLGRGIYALGGSTEGAIRAGFNVTLIRTFVFGYVGLLSGVAGFVHCCLSRMANPFDLVGMELNVIAAVVLGGARITGGYGTVGGALMGIGLIVIINNSLILLGVPSYWQRVVIGLLIILGTGIPAVTAKLGRRGLTIASGS
jgi:simple sugar transport system permease protein